MKSVKKNSNLKLLLLSVALAILFVGLFFAWHRLNLKPTTAQQAETILDNNKNTKLIYFGRPSCPECQRVNQFLKQNKFKNHGTIYYVNTDIKANRFYTLRLFSKYNLPASVPTIVYKSNGKLIKVRSKMTSKRLQELLNQN